MDETARPAHAPQRRATRKKTASGPRPAARTPRAPWTFLTNHAHVLVCLSQDPAARMRDVSGSVGVTERAVQRIVSELEEAGYIERHRDGRRNHYEIKTALPLRHPVESHCAVDDLLKLILRRPTRR